MKKLLTAIALIACLILPLSAMAMTTIADNELSTVTGQAGVSINVDVTASLAIGTIAWGDSDGAAAFGYASMGFVGLDNMNMTIHIGGRTDTVYSGGTISNGPLGTTGGANYFLNKPITIDVGSSATGAAVVVIGLPTFHITVSSLDSQIFLSGGTLAGGPTSTSAQGLGEIYLANVDVKLGIGTTAATMDAGYVTISSTPVGGNSGIVVGLNVKIGSVSIGTMSYGNNTSLLTGFGLGTAATAGFVGMTNLTLNNMTIAGQVMIGVGTLNTTALCPTSTLGTITQVSLVFVPGFNINFGTSAITGTILLGPTKDLVGSKELGNFYLQGLNLTLLDNVGSYSPHSVVQIWAH
jgi:hypothetical protein